MPRFTEGPYEKRENGDGGDYLICPVGYDTIIAEVPAEDVDGHEACANANLLAASWSMLKALEGVIRVADRKTDEFDAAREAVATAKGGS